MCVRIVLTTGDAKAYNSAGKFEANNTISIKKCYSHCAEVRGDGDGVGSSISLRTQPLDAFLLTKDECRNAGPVVIRVWQKYLRKEAFLNTAVVTV